ncbi:YtxH domain-containing protein [Cytobacillus massiliigabonensis]|uniref:YtxH domain-containing protein n=1 Tax=Cytobacillus massiliigabonensis TaxID=1871011 RepID=UPI000C83D29B|nr:YtxH domain-containing protein [Cytobacillus massiliigabonensis]
MKAKSLLIGFIIGGAVAGISTLLSAPASGRDSRKKIKEKIECIQNQLIELNRKFIRVKDATILASKEGKKEILAFSSDVKQSINQWKADILPHQQELQKELQAIEIAIHELEKNIK